MGSPEEKGLAKPRGPSLLPKIVWPDGSTQNDSTFLIKRLEKEYPQGRSVFPCHPGLAFLNDLLEDFADEWLTKCMYHYRWVHDPIYASFGIAWQVLGSAGDPVMSENIATNLRKRQVNRLSVVGSNDITGPTIESFYGKFIAKLDAHLAAGYPFLLGTRPSAADFAILAQLHPMISLDRETSDYTRKLSGRVCTWYNICTDLSGLSIAKEKKGWISAEEPLPPTLKDIFKDIGRFYVPFMLANDKAFHAGKKTFSCKLDDGKVDWEQPTFKYQSKCLAWMREGFANLNKTDQTWVLGALQGTNVEILFKMGARAKL